MALTTDDLGFLINGLGSRLDKVESTLEGLESKLERVKSGLGELKDKVEIFESKNRRELLRASSVVSGPGVDTGHPSGRGGNTFSRYRIWTQARRLLNFSPQLLHLRA